MARYRCKDCGRAFNALTGTPLAQLHRRDAWLACAQALVGGVFLRKVAARCGIALDTAFRWRHRFLASAKNARPKTGAGIVEGDETFIRKSAKASKWLAGRAPRKLGAKGRSGLSNDDYAPVPVVGDRHDATLDHVLPELQGANLKCILKPVVAPDAPLVSDGRAAYGRFADEAGLMAQREALNASAGERTHRTYHVQNVNPHISCSCLRQWIVRFGGVATKNLPNYIGWWRMTERKVDALIPVRCVVNALPQAAT